MSAEEFFEQLESTEGTLTAPMLIGTVVWLVVLIWQLVLVSKGKIFNGWKKKIEKAVREGRTVKAQRYFTNHRYRSTSGGSERVQTHTFLYEVEGRQYRKVTTTKDEHIDDVITLYYENNPRFAKTYGQMRGRLHAIWPLLSATLAGGAVLALLTYLGF